VERRLQVVWEDVIRGGKEAREGGGIKTGNVQGWFLRCWYTGGGLRLNTVATVFLLNHTVIFMHFSSFPKNNYLTADLRYTLPGP